MTVPVHLVKGSDDVLRSEAVSRLIEELVAGGDRSLLVDEFAGSDYDLGAAVDAAQTPPFLTDHRVVVARHLGRFPKGDDLAAVIDYLADPLPSTRLVLVWERSPDAGAGAKMPAVPPKLTKAVTAAGGEIVTADAPGGKGQAAWVGEHLAAADLHLDGPARARVVDLLGEDAGALIGLVERLRGAYGPGARLSLEQVEPFLGAAGGVPPWELTDAIDKGDVAQALDRLGRMMAGGGRHPLAIMATLHSHYARMLRLDGSGARGEKQAAEVLGMKGSTFPARKALTQGERLGHTGVVRAVGLLADADLDLRGAQAWPGDLVMEVLVARLARLAPARR
ncbi:MAG: holA [Acidimicrobiales bacterium]|nr:holA [Acidimicrobiales bacterium]